MQVWGDDDRRALLFSRLMELTHDGMLIRVHCQHGETDDPFPRQGVFPSLPYAGNAEWITRGELNLPSERLARFIAGFEKFVHEHQSPLPLSPCVAVARLGCNRFTAGVVRVTADFVVFGPTRDQTESGQTAGHASRLVALEDQRGSVSWIGLFGIARGHLDAQVVLHPLDALRWREMGTHRKWARNDKNCPLHRSR